MNPDVKSRKAGAGFEFTHGGFRRWLNLLLVPNLPVDIKKIGDNRFDKVITH